VATARHVIVAGAGIAGLTASLALARAGFRITLFEQAEKLKEVGAGIQLGPNATRVLIALGLREPLAAAAMAPRAIRVMAGGSGREIVRIPLGEHVERRYGAPYWVIHRGDLQAVLANAALAHPDITLRLRSRVEDFAIHASGVTVQGHGGGQVIDERGMALIGADGVWSALRKRLGRQRPARFAHRTAWRALLPPEAVPPDFREPLVHLWLGPDAHLVHYPVKNGRLINIVGIVRDDWKDTGWNAVGQRADILRHFARWAWDDSARDLIATPERWVKWALYARRHPFRGGSGPVTLIGDAAHPMLPFLAQGAGMAIEDAAVLADMLATYGDDVTDALRGYEGARRRRTLHAQRASRRQAHIYGLSGPEVLVRNMVMRVMGGERLLSRYNWLYSWRPPDIPKASSPS